MKPLYKNGSLSLPESKRFDRLVSSRKPFGLETTFKGKVAKSTGDILIYQNGGTAYVSRRSISTGTHLINKWKVFTGRAAPRMGNRDTYPHRIISTRKRAIPHSTDKRQLLPGPYSNQYRGCLSEVVGNR
jgi:hypothetical protein